MPKHKYNNCMGRKDRKISAQEEIKIGAWAEENSKRSVKSRNKGRNFCPNTNIIIAWAEKTRKSLPKRKLK